MWEACLSPREPRHVTNSTCTNMVAASWRMSKQLRHHKYRATPHATKGTPQASHRKLHHTIDEAGERRGHRQARSRWRLARVILQHLGHVCGRLGLQAPICCDGMRCGHMRTSSCASPPRNFRVLRKGVRRARFLTPVDCWLGRLPQVALRNPR